MRQDRLGLPVDGTNKSYSSVEVKMDELWNFVIKATGVSLDGIHGPQHWARVERNALLIAEENGGNTVVISLFALFHDSQRINDHIDPGHGNRGAEYARALRDRLSLIDDDEFELLCEACEGHTDIIHHENPTIQACWDADRLDLPRVGMTPSSRYLNTRLAKELADTHNLQFLDKKTVREF